jgi:hypothetical protein
MIASGAKRWDDRASVEGVCELSHPNPRQRLFSERGMGLLRSGIPGDITRLIAIAARVLAA